MTTTAPEAPQMESSLVYEVQECKFYPGEWIAETIDYEDEGNCYMARFTGQNAEERAKEYGDFKNRSKSTP